MWGAWPSEVTWRFVDRRLRWVLCLRLAAYGIPLGAGAVALSAWWWGATVAWWTAAVWLAALAGRAVAIGRAVRAWAYAEHGEHLLVRHGIWTRRLSIVPYGRMQFLDLSADPASRLFGLTTVKLHTAAATTDATVPGLPPAEATGLRDRLAAVSGARTEGL